MKKFIMLSLCIWLLAVGKAFADNTLSVANVTIPQGGQATLVISCDFTTEFVGGQLDLELPDDGKVTPAMSDARPVATFGFTGTDHTISSSQLKDSQEQLIPKYRFLFASINNMALPTTGTFMTIVLNASDTAEPGTVYNAKLSKIEFGTKGSAKTTPNDVPFTVTIAAPLPTVTLDEESTTAPTASNAPVNVIVNRKINANEWSTICLPFDMTAYQVKAAFGDDVKLADFADWSFEGSSDNVSKINIVFNDVNSIVKNHPYIIKVTNTITTFTVYNVSAVSSGATSTRTLSYYDEDSGDEYDGKMKGLKRAGKVNDGDLFLSGNKFYYSNGETNIKGFRATFSFDVALNDKTATSRITMSFDDNETTAINDVKVVRNDKTYSLSGQQVKNPAKGIYVKDGKKVIFK